MSSKIAKALFKMRRLNLELIGLVASFALIAASLVGYFSCPTYFLDTLSQLRIVYLYAAVPFGALFLLLRLRVVALCFVAAILIDGLAFLPLLMPKASEKNTKTITLVASNLWGGRNKAYGRFADFIHDKNPDLICLSEVNDDWLAELKKRLPDYRYEFDEGLPGGVALFSKLPITQVMPKEGKAVRRYGVRGEVQVGNLRVLIIAEHPKAPNTASTWAMRNEEFNRLIDDVAASKLPVIISGDFNSTPWSPYFRHLVEAAHLVDTEIGHGLQPTWNAAVFLPLVPIDHCLTTEGFVTLTRQVGPSVGSDHLPLTVTIGVSNRALNRK